MLFMCQEKTKVKIVKLNFKLAVKSRNCKVEIVKTYFKSFFKYSIQLYQFDIQAW